MKRKKDYFPIEFKNDQGKLIAHLDWNLEWHCQSKNKKEVLDILEDYASVFKEISKYSYFK